MLLEVEGEELEQKLMVKKELQPHLKKNLLLGAAAAEVEVRPPPPEVVAAVVVEQVQVQVQGQVQGQGQGEELAPPSDRHTSRIRLKGHDSQTCMLHKSLQHFAFSAHQITRTLF